MESKEPQNKELAGPDSGSLLKEGSKLHEIISQTEWLKPFLEKVQKRPVARIAEDSSPKVSLYNYLVSSKLGTQKKKFGYRNPQNPVTEEDLDSVWDHSAVVALTGYELALRVKEDLDKKFDIKVDPERVMTMCIFHDFGESRSGDTGAQSKHIKPEESCNLYDLETDGLKTNLSGTKSYNTGMHLYEEYRAYSGITALLSHYADKIEGLQKGLMHLSAGSYDDIFNVLAIFVESTLLFNQKAEAQGREIEQANTLIAKNYFFPTIREMLFKFRASLEKFGFPVEILKSKDFDEVMLAIVEFCNKISKNNEDVLGKPIPRW